MTDKQDSAAAGPDAIFLLIRTTGDYEDYRETPLMFLLDKPIAAALAAQAGAEYEAANVIFNDVHGEPSPGDDWNDKQWEDWERAGEKHIARFRASLSIDPDAAPGLYGYEDDSPGYSVWEIQSHAKAMEAPPPEPTP